ncbi:Toll/interleukin-1 receptor (TIR) domain-containing protein [Melia azedarach]|uniref:Toll/interleukin-1 receptor (TIR) domain-containing protein n=1 Tax=Melia azedarach TaxID=155640 RepID=A0ACC1YBI2_MELAZ|nr:Toll/interleukin-1 receptor (TIR) domain-containing protein [Melia azedarach]
MDVEGKRLRRCSIRVNHFLSSICGNGSEVLGKYKKRGFVALFLVLEAASVVLDVFGRSKPASLAAFLLSAFGFAINIFVCFVERTTSETKPQAKRQLGIVEVVFSLLQLIAASIHFILLVSDVKYNYNASVLFPLAFAIIAIVFVFKEEAKVTESSVQALSITKLFSDNISVHSTPIELDLSGVNLNHANTTNNLRSRSRQVKEAPGIEGFRIIGEAQPGEKLFGCGYAVNGTTNCTFQMTTGSILRVSIVCFDFSLSVLAKRAFDQLSIFDSGATNRDYVVTADDVDKLIALECIPMDDQGHQV